MLLKEVRHTGKSGERLLFKILIEKDTLMISAKCRGEQEPILVDVIRIVEPYIKTAGVQVLKKVCNVVYIKRQQELAKQAS